MITAAVIAHDRRLWCDALTHLLDDLVDATTVASAADEACAAASAGRGAAFVVLGGGLAGPDTAELCGALSRKGHAVLVIDPKPDDRRLATFVQQGAAGYLGESAPLEEFLAAAHTVLGGHSHVPTDMLGGLLRNLIDGKREADRVRSQIATLSKREREVLGHIVGARSIDDMAEAMFVSPATVRTHVQNVLRKLDVRSQLDAGRLIRDSGLAADPDLWETP